VPEVVVETADLEHAIEAVEEVRPALVLVCGRAHGAEAVQLLREHGATSHLQGPLLDLNALLAVVERLMRR
jgi:hypothetical protein